MFHLYNSSKTNLLNLLIVKHLKANKFFCHDMSKFFGSIKKRFEYLKGNRRLSSMKILGGLSSKHID